MDTKAIKSFPLTEFGPLERPESGGHLFLYCLEALLMLFIIGLFTLSNIEGLSTIVVVFGILLSWLFAIYFLHLRLKVQPEVILFFLWIAWSIIGVFNVHDLGLLLDGFVGILQIGVLLFLVAGLTAIRQSLTLTMSALVIGGLIVATSGIFTGEFQMAADLQTGTRIGGIAGNANAFAYHLLFVLFAAFYFLGTKIPHWLRILFWGVAGIAIVGVIYSGSRKMFVGVLAFVALWYIFCHGRKFFAKPIYTFLLVTSLAVGIYYTTTYVMSQTYLGQRIHRSMDKGEDVRTELYREGFEMIKSSPVFGVGLNNFRALSSFGFYSHSDYIEVAANTGIVGFLLYFSIYGVLWRRLNRIGSLAENSHLSYVTGLLKAAILTILLLAFGRPNITSKITWLFLGSAIGYSCSAHRELT